jgi:menaquinone-dependent protoporphyrinogen oxidase
MSILVAYASKHGATAGIAAAIAERLRSAGLEAEARPVTDIREPAAYDAYVIGGATYMFHWLKEATAFVRQHRALLATRPVWLFSSGPLGPQTTDTPGQGPRVVPEAREITELGAAIGARDHRVFWGAFDRGQKAVGLAERVTLLMPVSRAAMPEGDFRNWAEIAAWADGIARELAPAPAIRR